MINSYEVYTREMFDDKFAVHKNVLRAKINLPVVNKPVIFEYQFCAIIDLFSDESDNLHFNFNSVEDYYQFLQNDLDSFEENNLDEFMWGGYPSNLDEIEITFFMKNYRKNKQNGYLYSKIFDEKTSEELPAYYSVLFNFNEEKDVFRGLYVPEDENEILALLYENQFNFWQKGFERDKILNFDYPYNSIFFEIQKLITKYLKENEINILEFNTIFNQTKQLKDMGVVKYLQYVLKSFALELQEQKIAKSCKFCECLFKYLEVKEYCSDECKIKARNKRYYKKNAPKIKKKRMIKE